MRSLGGGELGGVLYFMFLVFTFSRRQGVRTQLVYSWNISLPCSTGALDDPGKFLFAQHSCLSPLESEIYSTYWVLWLRPIVSALQRMRQENCLEFEVTLHCMVNSKPASKTLSQNKIRAGSVAI